MGRGGVVRMEEAGRYGAGGSVFDGDSRGFDVVSNVKKHVQNR